MIVNNKIPIKCQKSGKSSTKISVQCKYLRTESLPSVFTNSAVTKCVANVTHVEARYYRHTRLTQCTQWMFAPIKDTQKCSINSRSPESRVPSDSTILIYHLPSHRSSNLLLRHLQTTVDGLDVQSDVFARHMSRAHHVYAVV